MAFQKLEKYWKIVDIKIDRQLNKARVTLVGFKDKDDAAKPKFAQFIPGYQKKVVELKDTDFPFVENTTTKDKVKVSQIAFTYLKVKEKEKFFKDAQDV
jgi:hypothetical protein